MSPTHANDHELAIRGAYLNTTFFYTRVFFYFFYFCLAGLYYRRNSVLQDRDGNPVLTRRMHDHSYLALVIFGLLQTFLGFDWFMGSTGAGPPASSASTTTPSARRPAWAAGIVLIALLRGAGYLFMMNHGIFISWASSLRFHHLLAYIAFGQ